LSGNFCFALFATKGDEMQEVWLHFEWPVGTDRPVIFGAHETEESARLDCPADVLDEDRAWVLEGVAPLGGDPHLLAGLKDYVELWRGLES
jgi:hypothetical protein